MAAPHRRWAAELLHVWFHKLRPAQWFGGSDEVDILLERRFERELAMLWSCRADTFLTDPRTALAAVLLFDQLPRNLYRESADAFGCDTLARAITHGALRRGFDRVLAPRERQFLYLPLMHSEDIADQRLSLQLFARLPRPMGWDFARSHYRMVARFGRFPHRNKVLGRANTPEEDEFLAGDAPDFGQG